LVDGGCGDILRYKYLILEGFSKGSGSENIFYTSVCDVFDGRFLGDGIPY
jgi:hypothetical protein